MVVEPERPYHWALRGGPMERPLYYTEDRFVPVAPRGDGPTTFAEMSFPEIYGVGPKKPFMDGRFLIAACKVKLGPHAAVAFDGDKLISILYMPFGYTLPEYRGSGIGAELIAEYDVWCPIYGIHRQVNKSVTMVLSRAGEAMMRKSFRIMVERGAVIPREGDNSWHLEQWKSRANTIPKVK